MSTETTDLLQQAVAGDQDALSQMLMDSYGRLRGYISRRIPDHLTRRIDPDEMVNEVHIEVFKTIGRFEDRGEDSFVRWMMTIAKLRIIDKIRALGRIKRPSPDDQIEKPVGQKTNPGETLIDRLVGDSHTPSRSAARREGARVVMIALAALDEHYREALMLRYIQALPVKEIAEKMGRTERSVHMLCNRGLKKLREAMGSRSRYLSA